MYHKSSYPPTTLSCISAQLSKGSLFVRKREQIMIDKTMTSLHWSHEKPQDDESTKPVLTGKYKCRPEKVENRLKIIKTISSIPVGVPSWNSLKGIQGSIWFTHWVTSDCFSCFLLLEISTDRKKQTNSSSFFKSGGNQAGARKPHPAWELPNKFLVVLGNRLWNSSLCSHHLSTWG